MFRGSVFKTSSFSLSRPPHHQSLGKKEAIRRGFRGVRGSVEQTKARRAWFCVCVQSFLDNMVRFTIFHSFILLERGKKMIVPPLRGIILVSGERYRLVVQRSLVLAALHHAVPRRAPAHRRLLGEQRGTVPRPSQFLRRHKPGDRRAVPPRPLLEGAGSQLRLHRGRW